MSVMSRRVLIKSERTQPSALLTILAFAAVYIVWGSTYLAIRIGVETLPGFVMAGTRFVIAGGLLYAWARLRGASKPSLKDWRAATITGVALLTIGNGLVVQAERFVPSGFAALVIATEPLWIVVLNWVRPNGERPTARTVAGLLLGFIGVLVLVKAEPNHGGFALLSTVALVIAAFSWAAGSLYSARYKGSGSPLLIAGMQMLSGGVFLMIVSVALGEWSHFDIRNVSSRSLLGLAYLIVFGSIIGFTAYSWLLKNVTPARASTYAYVNPMVAVLLGWAFAGERVTLRTLTAATVIIASVVLTVGGDRSRESEAAPESKQREVDELHDTTDCLTQPCAGVR